MESEKVLSMLSLCRRAGKLSYGFDSVKTSVLQGEGNLCLLACDASEKTAKEAAYYCQRAGVPLRHTGLSRRDIASKLHREYAVLCVCDDGFASGLQTLLACDQ